MASENEFKIVVVGAGGVGKSGLTLQFCAGKCPKRYNPTIEDSYRKSTEVDGKPCTLDILDTAGQDEYASLRSEYMTEGKGFVLVYSITDEESFKQMVAFKKQIEDTKKNGEKIPIYLVGNKCDLEGERKVTTSSGENKAREWKLEMKNADSKISNVDFIETSAMNKINVEEMFKGLVRRMMDSKGSGGSTKSVPASSNGNSNDRDSDSKQKDDKAAGCSCSVQ